MMNFWCTWKQTWNGTRRKDGSWHPLVEADADSGWHDQRWLTPFPPQSPTINQSARRQTSQVITGAGADNWFRGSPWSISCQMIPACLCLRNHFWEVWLIRVLSLDLSNANSSSHPTQLMCTSKVGLHFNPKKQTITLPFLGPDGPLIEPSRLEGPASCK